MILVLALLLNLSVIINALGNPNVIVIGAGPAGIAAATRLLENGVNVTVLEAENRIGGRVHSVHFDNAIIDLGAEWCHGEGNNIIYELVKDLDILQHSKYHFQLYSSNRDHVDEQFSHELHEIFDDIYTADGNKKQNEGISVGEYFIKTYNNSVHDRYVKENNKLDFALTALECFHHYVLSSEGAFSWFDTSANSDYRDCEGDLGLNWNGRGYHTALEVIMKKFPKPDPNFPIDEAFLLNKEVKKILWNNTEVILRCTDETEYKADYVIMTASLGVLKNKQRTLFEPSLPEKKVKAIRDLGIGAVMKVMMQFNERWWPKENFTGFSFVWSHHHKEMLVVEFPDGPSRHGRSWLLELFGVYRVENNPRVLSAWFAGELIPEIENTSDEVVTNGIIYVMEKFLGHKYNITKPEKILRSKWYSNPHFRGTYSFQTVESRKAKPSSNTILSESLKNSEGTPQVLFAGEATHPYHYSTVHGAVETGFREADKIIKELKNKNVKK